ncbi:MAG TPA: acyl-CoA dehydrogenase family protein [Candidatus Baltobacteraceae bacterium]|nr:acyl-CoA dehydrogenase family protein [Candidatus Baltobacteraceae bacterium]
MVPDQRAAPNQPPPLSDYNVFRSDAALVNALAGLAPSDAFETLDILGAMAGSAQAQDWAVQANAHPPLLRTHDRYGNRIDEVTYHPYYHELMAAAVQFGLHAAPWSSNAPAAHTVRAAKFYVWGQLEAGHGCPISMTYAAVPAIGAAPALACVWEPKLTAWCYDGELQFVTEKTSALCGMAMTEKQGGSDVRANTTRATPCGAGDWGQAYLLRGHKWFCSAPMSDAFLVLAQADQGLTCFLLPRVLADGSRNRMFIARLKDKLGNRSNASAEIEFDDAWAVRVGQPGCGLQTILEMVNFTRLDCINGSAALMRAGLAQAAHHATYRHAFGKALIEQPLMQNVIADLAIESEAAMRFLLRVAASVDRCARDPRELLIKRLGTAVGKYYVCKRAPAVVAEALECLGGNGYVEESGMPRLFCESPLNSIWEGSGNVNALDVFRLLTKQPDVLDAFRAEIEPSLNDPRIRAAAEDLFRRLRTGSEDQARVIAERTALLWQASLLYAAGDGTAADLFIASRLNGAWSGALGTLPAANALGYLARRAAPVENVEYTVQ